MKALIPSFVIASLATVLAACGSGPHTPFIDETKGDFVSIVYSLDDKRAVSKTRRLAASFCAERGKRSLLMSTLPHDTSDSEVLVNWYKCI